MSSKKLLPAVLAIVLLAALLTLPWQIRNWREAAALRRDASRQQAYLQQLQQAQSNLRQAHNALRAAPTDPNAQLALAAQLTQNQDFPGAAAQLKALEPAAKQSADLSGAAAGLYQKIGYIDRAVALARQAHQLAPASPEAALRLGVLDMQIGWQAPGQALLNQAALALPLSAEPHLALALAANQSGAYKEAEKELLLADRLRPGDWHIQALLADNRSAQGRNTEALQSLAEAQKLAPQEAELYAKQAGVLLTQARTQGAGKKIEIAPIIQAARQGLTLNPNNAEAHNTLGLAYRDAGQEAEARREWEQAYALAPNDPVLGYNLGRLRIAQGDRTSGLQLLAEAARLAHDNAEYDRLVILTGSTPNNPQRHQQLAQWCMTHHHVSRAIFEWQEVIRLLPRDAEARRNAVQLLAQRG